MAALTHSGSRPLCSWWWDSHISPKNSKWLQENLTDMDVRVKAMIKLIEEDADSFARRAEMYYKKRPELMKLLEEIYRAYRALAERYDYATVELRQAHRTMAEVFPNQVPYDLIDESPSESSVSGPEEPRTPEMFHGVSKRGRGQVDEDGCSRSSSRNQNLEGSGDSSETQGEDVEEVLTKIEAEKESTFLKYQQALEELSNLETELKNAQQEAAVLDHRASKAEIEVKILKEALSGMEAERNANLLLYNESLETISKLKNLLSLSQEEAEALDMRACKAKTESQYLRLQVSSLESEKEASLRQYKQCLEKISLMEAKISAAEENLDSALVKCSRLEDSNGALQLEASNLMQEIAMKDQELARRQVEFEKFQIQMHNEQSLFKQVETSLHTLQDLHSRSQDEQKALALELKNSLRMVKDLSIHRLSVEEELQKVKEENRQLGLDAEELQRHRNYLENEFKLLKQELGLNENEKHDLQETMKQLVFEATQKEQHEKFLAGEIQMQNLNLESLRRDYLVLQRENSDLIKEKRTELEKFLDLKDAYHGLEEENSIIIEEAVALDVFSLVFESFTAAKAMEIKALNQDFDRLLLANIDLKNTVEELAESLVMKETEILRLNNLVEKLDSVLHEVKKHNDLLIHEIVLGNNFLRQKVEGLSETEQELKDSQQLNAKLCNRVEELKMECKELTLIRENLEIENLQLCIDGHRQNEEISWLLELNENLKSEVDLLYNEVEECRIREVDLSSELQESRAWFELWEAEAASINFDLQASSVREVFLENQLHEITQACKKIGGESAGKDVEIQSLRESYRILQSETGKLKPEFSATFFDQNLKPHTKRFGNGTQMRDIPLDQVSGFSIYGRSKKESREANDQMLQSWETVEPMTDQSFIAGESHNPTFLPLLSNPNVGEEKNHSGSSLDIEREPLVGGARFERSSSIRERSQGGKKRKILQRLASDAQKLTILRTTVDDLNKRMETKKWSKKESYIEHEKVCKQLRDVEETVLQLVNTNGQLTKNVEQSPSSLAGKTASELEIENGTRNNMMEQTRKASEKIGRLHLEVQNIQLVLQKMEEEKKRKWKTRFSKNKTGIILKDFIYNGKKSSDKEKKNSFWGCQRPPRNED